MYDCGFSIILEVKTVLVFYVTDQQNFIPTKISVSTSNVLNFFFFIKRSKLYTLVDIVVFCYTNHINIKWIMKTLFNINNNNIKTFYWVA